MERLKVVKIDDALIFDDGTVLESYHDQDCCERHWLEFSDLTLSDFDGLEFDLTGEEFFTRIEDYGIAVNPVKGHPIRIPGYGSNNGWYSTNLLLVVTRLSGEKKEYDITECQAEDVEP